MKRSLTDFKFIKQEKYVLFNKDYILKELRKMIEAIRKRFNRCDLKKYSFKKVNSEDCQYIEQIQKQEKSFSLKN